MRRGGEREEEWEENEGRRGRKSRRGRRRETRNSIIITMQYMELLYNAYELF